MEWVVKNDRDLRERGANGDGEDMDKERIGASSRICKPLRANDYRLPVERSIVGMSPVTLRCLKYYRCGSAINFISPGYE